MNIKEDLMKIVGAENVSDDKHCLEEYAGSQSFRKHIEPWFVVRPQDAEQVEELVKWAGFEKIPLVPVSSQAPHIKGGSAPDAPEAVIVDMSGMNQILSVNRQQRMVVVEPGVTYEQLDKALEKENLELPMPLRPKKNKSVLASALEIEPRMNPMLQWSYLDPLRCVEVIWGDGNRMYTGEAASVVRDLKQQQENQRWQVNPYGPWMFDFYRVVAGAQGTMGIVTWAALKCQVRRTIHDLYFVAAETFESMQNFVYRAMHFRFPDELFVLNNADMAALLGNNEKEVREWKKRLPKWTVLVGVGGRELLPDQRAAARSKDLAETAQLCGLALTSTLAGINGRTVVDLIDKPSDHGYWKDQYKGSSQDIFFVTKLDETKKFIEKIHLMADEMGYPVSDIGTYIQPLHIGSSYHCEFTLPYDPESDAEKALAEKMYKEVSLEFAKMGAYYSRPYEIWSSMQLNKDAVSYDALNKLKDIFDPNKIMNPGKLIV